MELMFAVEDAGVNGYTIDPFWAKSIAPGKSYFIIICVAFIQLL